MSIKKNFSSRLSLYVLLVAAGVMIALTTWLCFIAVRRIRMDASEKVGHTMDNAILTIEKVLSGVERSVDNLDWVVEQHYKDEQFLYEATRELVSGNADIIGSAIAFEPGYYKGRHYFCPYSYIDEESKELRTIHMGNENYDYPALDWYRIPKELDCDYWSEPYFDAGGGGQRMSTYSMPLKDADGHLFGILTADISLEWLSDLVSSLKPYKDSYLMIIGRDGTYIAHPDSLRVLNTTIFSIAAQMTDTTAMLVGREMIAGHKGMKSFMDDDRHSFVVYGPLSNGWSVGLVCSYLDVFGASMAMMGIVIFGQILGLLLLFFGCRRIIRNLTMPLVEFSNAAITMAKGNFKAVIPEVRSQDEIRTLRNSLDYMQRSLNSYIAELKVTTASNERYESELTIARDIQMSMLPQNFPKRRDCDIHAMVHPAKEVGGDLYDFIEVEDSLFFLVGDVSGKGVPAALFMAIARAAFRFIGALGLPLAEVMRRVNDCLCDGNTSEMFVTIFAGRLDLKTGQMEYCNAGHNPIVIVPPDGNPAFLRAKPNLAAGLFIGFPYESETMSLAPGTRLVIYTDGVTEAEREDKSQFGEDALLEWARHLNPDASSEAAAYDLYASVRRFTGNADQNDDITIMSINLKQNNNQA